MRLLQLVTGAEELIDLHPQVTVVRGLDDARHAHLVGAVRGLAKGTGVGSGLLEAHGVLFELDSALLELLGIEAGELDPIVSPTDLPLQPLTVDAQELRAREQAFADLLTRITAAAERQSNARGAVAAATAALAEARRAQADASENAERRIARADELAVAVDQLIERCRLIEDRLAERRPLAEVAERALAETEARTAAARERVEATAARAAALADELAALDAARDPYSVAAVDEAEAELRRLEAEIEAERTAPPEPPDPDAVDPEVRAAELEDRLRHLDQLAPALTARGVDAVVSALAALVSSDDAERVPSGEAHDLAAELDALVARIEANPPEISAEDATASRERLDDARQSLLEAEQAARSLSLDRADIDRLELAHETLLDAIDRADSRFGGSRARARVDELRAAQQEILDQLGFGSYSDYMMGNSLLLADPEKDAALEAARVELHAAEKEWHRIEHHTEAALAHAALLDRRRGMYEEARRLLGELPGDDRAITTALRDLRVPLVPEEALAATLRQSLEAAGIDLADEELDTEELVMVAEAWVGEAGKVDDRAEAIDGERRALLTELESLGPLLGTDGRERIEPVDPEVERTARLEAAKAAVVAAEVRWAAHEDAESRWSALQARVREANDEAARALTAAEPATEELEAVRRRSEPLRAGVDELEAELAEATEARAAAEAELREARDPRRFDPVVLAAEVAAATDREREAVTTLEAAGQSLSALDAEGQALAVEIERLQDIVAAQGSGSATEADELEWYLLARVASQRALSIAGSMPLLLDDALRGLDGDEVDHLLERLERMAEAVQMIIVSDDPLVAEWATQAGPARAAVVQPTST